MVSSLVTSGLGGVVSQSEVSAEHVERLASLAELDTVRDEGRGGQKLARRAWWRDSLRRRMLALADVLTAGVVSLTLALDEGPAFGFWAAILAPVWIVLAKLHALYDRDHRAIRHLTVDELPSLLVWTMGAVATTTAFLAVAPPGAPDVGEAVKAWAAAAAAAVLLRSAARYLWRRTTPAERTVIIGRGRLAEATRRKLELFPDMHLELVGTMGEVDLAGLDAAFQGVDRVVLASAAINDELITSLLRFCRSAEIKLSVVPPVRGAFGTAVHLGHIADLPVVECNTWDVSRSTLLLKRALDVAISLAAIVLLAAVAALIALAIRLESPGPIVFTQRRAGIGGRPFRMLKFRTMVDNAEELLGALVPFDTLREPMFKLQRDPRATRVGRVLRRMSLDELPQLLNVLKGDMSLVGPRPEQIELVDRYLPEHRFRLAVKPGMTGPMQVFGRGELSFDERLALEREYIENLSLGRDLRILALTSASVLHGRGAF
jgi:exopolysaccharide biosynthesis polyprenyl glycosylphosphotransferase